MAANRLSILGKKKMECPRAHARTGNNMSHVNILCYISVQAGVAMGTIIPKSYLLSAYLSTDKDSLDMHFDTSANSDDQ